jgi:vacuolar-type H+-ATPase subunit H
VSVPFEDESFAAGRQALLDALQGLEQRAHDRAERTLREAEQRARQVIIEAEAHAHQVVGDAEGRAERLVTDAEQRARQVTLDAGQRIAELEQQLAEVRDNLESARAQLEEQFVAIHGLVEVARANLNTARERASAGPRGIAEPRGAMRVSIPPLSGQTAPPTTEARRGLPTTGTETEDVASNLSELRATVENLKRPHRGEQVSEGSDVREEIRDEESGPAPDEASQGQAAHR